MTEVVQKWVQQVTPHDGDVFFLRGTFSAQDVDTFLRLRQAWAARGHKVLFLHLDDKAEIAKVSEDEMREFGWVRQ